MSCLHGLGASGDIVICVVMLAQLVDQCFRNGIISDSENGRRSEHTPDAAAKTN